MIVIVLLAVENRKLYIIKKKEKKLEKYVEENSTINAFWVINKMLNSTDEWNLNGTISRE